MNKITRSQAIELGLKSYFTGKPCKHGHVSVRILPSCNCLECIRSYKEKPFAEKTPDQQQKRKLYMKEYRLKNADRISKYNYKYNRENADKIAAKSKRWLEANKEKSEEYKRKYREENRQRIRDNYKTYYQENKHKIFDARAEYQREYRIERYKTDENWKMAFKIRAFLARVLSQTSGKKTAKSEVMIGYTRQELVSHIESKMQDGMSWSNYGEWHIDHIKPLSLFIKEGETRPDVINALSNLQPLWAKDNMSKGAREVCDSTYLTK